MVLRVSLPKEVSGHHTVWVTPQRGRAVPVRYATANGRLYCFGDNGLASVHDGERVRASIRRIACGPSVAEFVATARSLPPASIDREALLQLLEHVPLGRTLDEVEHNLEEHQRRRVIELIV